MRAGRCCPAGCACRASGRRGGSGRAGAGAGAGAACGGAAGGMCRSPPPAPPVAPAAASPSAGPRHLVLLVLLVLVFGIVVTALPCRRWLPPFLLTQCDCFARRAIGRVDASRCLSPNCQLGGLARAFRRTESAVHLSPLGRHGGRWTALEGWTGPAQLGPVLGPVLGARNRSLARKRFLHRRHRSGYGRKVVCCFHCLAAVTKLFSPPGRSDQAEEH